MQKTIPKAKLKAFGDGKCDLTIELCFVLGSIGNIMGKKKKLVTSVFSFFHSISLPATKTYTYCDLTDYHLHNYFLLEKLF